MGTFASLQPAIFSDGHTIEFKVATLFTVVYNPINITHIFTAIKAFYTICWNKLLIKYVFWFCVGFMDES